MNIAPELIRRTKSSADVEDLALLFVEEELGRYDFKNNWKRLKESGKARARIENWLTGLGTDASPDEIIESLDRIAKERSGPWI